MTAICHEGLGAESFLLNFGTRFPLKREACQGGWRKVGEAAAPALPGARLGLFLAQWWRRARLHPRSSQAAAVTGPPPRLPQPSTLPSTDVHNSRPNHGFQSHVGKSRSSHTAQACQEVPCGWVVLVLKITLLLEFHFISEAGHPPTSKGRTHRTVLTAHVS